MKYVEKIKHAVLLAAGKHRRVARRASFGLAALVSRAGLLVTSREAQRLK